MKQPFLIAVLTLSSLLASAQCSVQFISQNNNLCFGDCKADATVAGTGGTSPYTYSWNNGQTAPTATGLCNGTFTVTVTDAVACTATRTVSITSPPQIVIVVNQTNPSCFGLCDGSATAVVTGGVQPYQYYWIPTGDTTATITNLCDVSNQGPYILNLADNNGCTPNSIPVIINQPPGLSASVTSQNVCVGSSNGSAYANATGGTGLYTYSWNPSGQTTYNATNLTVGTYTVTITDANGCSIQRNVTISQPPLLQTITGQTNITCNGTSTGSASLTVTGGTPGYSYLWSTIPPQITSTATGIAAGTYTCTVTDNNGCTLTRTVTITEPAAMAHNSTITTATCLSCDGKIVAAPSGGTTPYTYSWSGGQTVNTISNLCAGVYSLTLTDATGCSKTFAIVVNNNGGSTTATTSQTNILCGGACTGAASISPAGGTLPYTYSWTPSNHTTASATGICAGAHTIKVTDAAGCVNFFTVTITEPPAITPNITKNNITCNGANNGNITVVTTGGTGTLTYSWSPGGQTTANLSGLSGGTYTLTIRDANSCTITRTVNIVDPAVLICSATPTNPSCNGGNNGTASTLVTGGTTPYTYFWSPTGGTGSTGTGLSAGTYTVTITDTNGCTATKTVTVNEPAAITASFNTTNIPCFGGTTGSTTVSAASGVGNYTYSWMHSGQTTTNITGLSAGTYSVHITDGNGCTTIQTVTITSPPQIVITLAKTDAGCATCTNGTASSTVTGGTGTYSYVWSPGGQTTASVTGLSTGLYTVCVTDANNCSKCDTIRIKNILDGINDYAAADHIKLFPNPAKDQFSIHLVMNKPAEVELTITNALGEPVKQLKEKWHGAVTKQLDTKQFPPGVYFVRMRIDETMYVKKLIIN